MGRVPETGLSLLVSSGWVNPVSGGAELLGFCWTTSSFSLTQSVGALFKKGWRGCPSEVHEKFQPRRRILLQMVEGPADCAVNTSFQGFLQHPANSLGFPPCPSGRVWVGDPISRTSLTKLPHLWVVAASLRTKFLPHPGASICGEGTYLCATCSTPILGSTPHTHAAAPIILTPQRRGATTAQRRWCQCFLVTIVTKLRRSGELPSWCPNTVSAHNTYLSLSLSPVVFWIGTQTSRGGPAGSPVWRIRDKDFGDLCVDHLPHSPNTDHNNLNICRKWETKMSWRSIALPQVNSNQTSVRSSAFPKTHSAQSAGPETSRRSG